MKPARYYTTDEFRARARCGRTRLYKILASGDVVAVKCGARTLIVAESGDAYLAALPRATFQTGLNKRSAPIKGTAERQR